MKSKSHLKQTLLWSIIGIHIFIFSLFIGQTLVPIPKSMPAVLPSEDSTHRIEYVLEKVGSKKIKNIENDENELDPVISQARKGYWIVEQYREYEVHYNKNGRILYKTPTPYQTYIRYWHEEPAMN